MYVDQADRIFKRITVKQPADFHKGEMIMPTGNKLCDKCMGIHPFTIPLLTTALYICFWMGELVFLPMAL